MYEKSDKPIKLEFSSKAIAKPGERFARSNWECWSFEYVLNGTGFYEINNEMIRLSEGDMYLLPYGKAHNYYADTEEPWSKIFFGVSGEGVELLIEIYNLHGYLYFQNSECLDIFESIFNGSRDKNIDTDNHVAIEFHKLLIKLTQKISKSQDQYSPPIRKAINFLNNSVEVEIGISEIAKKANLSSSHFSRKFLSEVGISPYEYLIQLRMQLAERLLHMTNLPIKKIADNLCYADAFYFSNAFKKHSGLSPQNFRNKANPK
jgi:AraC family transcriptional regulator, arabinose operon regulatory protein